MTLIHKLDKIDVKIANDLIKRARNSPNVFKHAAVLLSSKGEPIVYGFNNHKRHAEFTVIQKFLKTHLPRGKKAHSMVVVSINYKTGAFRNSKPCKKCEKLIEACGIKTYHT